MATNTLGKRSRDAETDQPHKRSNTDGQQRQYPPGLEVPHGWIDCPPMGTPLERIDVIPVKVPLGRRFCSVIPQQRWFTPDILVDQMAERGITVGLVLDLTNTGRYYNPEEWESLGVRHVKIFCRGRGSAPEPEAVNEFCWTLMSFLHDERREGKHAVVHCTHGYNRTGYMVASYLSRTIESKPLPAAVRHFATHRVPGIYKDDYLNSLFSYNHYKRGPEIRTPPLPDWKARDDQPESDAEEEALPEEEPPPMQHDDLLGEAVSEDEAVTVRQCIVMAMRGKSEHEAEYGHQQHFPGSQPVSLDRTNLELLTQRRYMVTWKADGTRYLLLLCMWGAYLVDRSFHVRRVQMRFPKSTSPVRRGGPARKPGPHHFTLLDGEMVVDENLETDQRVRRYLAYDMVLDNTSSVATLPFIKRFQLIDSEVVRPRAKEKLAYAQPSAKFVYSYGEEPFSVRRKDFWRLSEAGTVLDRLIPSLSHESDGLILQGADDPYVNGTCQELLKWKFAHMNSVDFLLLIESGQPVLYLMETRNRSKTFVPLKGAQLQLRDGQDVKELENQVIECSFDASDKSWVFMRVRRDKDTPNAFHVYEKVLRSIQDNIGQDFLLEKIALAIQGKAYDGDRQQVRP